MFLTDQWIGFSFHVWRLKLQYIEWATQKKKSQNYDTETTNRHYESIRPSIFSDYFSSLITHTICSHSRPVCFGTGDLLILLQYWWKWKIYFESFSLPLDHKVKLPGRVGKEAQRRTKAYLNSWLLCATALQHYKLLFRINKCFIIFIISLFKKIR